MTNKMITYRGGLIFDGLKLHSGWTAQYERGRLIALQQETTGRLSGKVVDLEGDILSPGYVDLQVNGGGGIMFNDSPSLKAVECISEAHRELGTSWILPTLISDSSEKTQAAIDAIDKAVATGVPGVAGLHLEGPHLNVVRRGAHEAEKIRPMEDFDLERLLAAARKLPVLKVTIAPECVTLEQVRTLTKAGVIVSMGHSDATFEACNACAAAGARCATHLFNALSQLSNREPGLVGAVLARGDMSAGLIADGIHVHPATMRSAWSAKTGPGKIFLVSDAMAVAGTDETRFYLAKRRIQRERGRLTMEDGTLAGADLDLTSAIRTLRTQVGVALEDALCAATSIPANLIGRTVQLSPEYGTLLSDTLRISSDFSSARYLCSFAI